MFKETPEGALERWVFALEASDTGAWELNLSDGTAWRSPLHDQIFGYSELLPDWTYSRFLQHVVDEDRARTDRTFQQVLRERGKWNIECRIRRADGERRWIAARGRVQCDDQGRPLSMWGTVRDITERKRVDQALRDSEERYRTLFESINEGFCIIERLGGTAGERVDFRYVIANPAFARHSGLGDAVGKTLRQVVPKDAEHWVGVYSRVLDTGEGKRAERLLESLGRTLEVYAFRVEDGTNRHVGVIFSDVTERMRIENALRESEERLGLALSAGRSGAWDWDVIRNVSTVSPSYRELYGFPDDLNVTYDVWLSAVHPDDRERVKRYGEEFFRSGSEWRLQYRILHTQRGERWMEAVGRLHRTPDGQPLRFIGVQRDVTERKHTEEALRESDRRKDEFLAVLGHELRNPLAPLSTGLELLLHARKNPSLIDTVHPMMERQIAHLERLIDDLLDVSRISRGQAQLQQSRFDLRGAVDAAVEQCERQISEHRNQLTLQLIDAPLPIHGDFQRLTQVIANLLSNAAKYSYPGGAITVTTEGGEGEAVVRVADTGFGIPRERLDRLFQMFFQIPEHQALVGGGGLGIGLALSRQLIELHGGSISVTSEGLTRGSEFVVRLPLAPPASELGSVKPYERAAARHRQGRRVLIVDDNLDAAESLQTLLELQGHEARCFADGPSALSSIEAFAPDVVLLDIGLPEMDGYEVARRIRGMPMGKDVHLFALTGWGQEEDKQRAREAGFDEHLTKPVDMRLLSSLIASAPTSN